MLTKVSIYDYNLENLENKIIDLGLKKFNAKQIFKWIYQKKVNDFFKITNISKQAQIILNENFQFPKLKIIKKMVDKKDGTIKILFELEDKEKIETVLMNFDYGYSVCVSSQVGCNMGCKFCASGLLKKIRNLSTSEIIMQFLEMQKILSKVSSKKISNIVFMGVGEPFDNFDNVINSIKIINNQFGIGLGSRRVTISTCGLVDKISKFAKELPQVNLAISLHAPNDKIRNQIMPINNKWKINDLINEVKKYIEQTNRRVTFEYILLDGINDDNKCANELANLLHGMLCYVNLILYNNVNENKFKRSKKVQEFNRILKEKGINSTIRLERGNDIDAACGQLRSKHEK